ncbi:MAG: DUF3177 family protein [Cyanobacteria bacterium P01_H01_bin.121]
MSENLLRLVVWTDYRLAVIFTVLIPLVLLIWAFVQRVEAIQRLLVIYWRVASLLAVTVYLMIAALPIGFLTGWLARVLIPLCLWFWVDLNDDIVDLRAWRPLKVAFNAWRWAITIYSSAGALLSLFFVRCSLLNQTTLLTEASQCRLWLDPPWGFKEYFHPNMTPGFLGFMGIVGLIVYVLSFGYFIFFRLGRQGRSATGQ